MDEREVIDFLNKLLREARAEWVSMFVEGEGYVLEVSPYNVFLGQGRRQEEAVLWHYGAKGMEDVEGAWSKYRETVAKILSQDPVITRKPSVLSYVDTYIGFLDPCIPSIPTP